MLWTPEEVMQRALTLARRCRGRTAPNPPVGAVLQSSQGEVIGEGSHQVAGSPHAEVCAIEDALKRTPVKELRGSTLTVTLEPCNHYGKTPPCSKRIVEAGIKKVVYSVRDPHKEASGGTEYLRAQGIEVISGVLEREGKELIAPFAKWALEGRPLVHLKWAQSLDGKISAKKGERTQISGAGLIGHLHELRSRVDGILIGGNTQRIDDPLLTVRLPNQSPHHPMRVVFTQSGKLNLEGNVFCSHEGGRTLVFSLRKINASHEGPHKVDFFSLERELEDSLTSQKFLFWALKKLAMDFSIQELLVESGGGLALELLEENLVDKISTFLSPIWIGDEGTEALKGKPFLGGGRSLFSEFRIEKFGEDVLIEGCVSGSWYESWLSES